MLKTKQTKEGWEALSETEQAHYTAGADGVYVLQHDEAVTLKRALDTERKRADRGEKLLKSILPELPDDRTEWDLFVSDELEKLTELRAVDIDEWKSHKSEDPKNPKQKSDLENERLQLQQQVREMTREKDAIVRERDKATKRVETLLQENLGLSRSTALADALDSVKITGQEDRETVTALLTYRGLEQQEVSGKKVFFVKGADGTEVPLNEYVKDFVATDLGKRYVKAPDSAGAGDGSPTPTAPVAKTAFEGMTPAQKLTAALSPAGVAGGAPAAAR